jgi:hypothetical protein
VPRDNRAFLFEFMGAVEQVDKTTRNKRAVSFELDLIEAESIDFIQEN